MFKSFRAKITAISVALIVISLVVTAVLSIRVSSDTLRAQITRNLQQQLQSQSNAIANWMKERKAMITATGKVIEQTDSLSALKQLSDGGGFLATYLARPNGSAIFSDEWQPPSDYNPLSREWYRLATQQSGVLATVPYLDASGENRLVVTFSHGLGPNANRGVIAGDVPLTFIIDTVRDIAPTRHSFAFLTNNAGKIIAHPNPDMTLKSLRDLNPSLTQTMLTDIQNKGDRELDLQGQAIYLTSQSIPGTNWSLNIALDKQDALSGLYSMIRWTIIAVIIIGVVAAAIMWFFSASGFKRLQEVSLAMTDIGQGEGDLTQRITAQGDDEIATIAKAFNAFVEKIHRLVKEVNNTAQSVSAASKTLADITQQSAGVVAQQSSETEQVATAMNEMTATVQEVASHASEAASQASEADTQTKQGQTLLRETLQQLKNLDDTLQGSSTTIAELQSGTQDIVGMLDVISSVSEQTNLLALNAAIEAARAGEHGRGFAVVADEVRGLAGRTQESTQQIQEVVDRLFKQTENVVSVMSQSRSAAQTTVTKAEDMAARLEQINQAVTLIADMNLQIATAAEEQSSVAELINQNVVNINDLSSQTEQASHNLMDATQSLSAQASQLHEQVSQFKI
ncbi:methyl-accepting chemotaxis protein [Vibrio cincinnatiensis]|uniref:methyl-accepting chemotaxis protein n=1 Tax=Vibrio cincinnatiensis TaxID=675 RepID=UPI001EDE45D0|nr:methyl-accepting chemotaxis protein [Vibrio cincinnatiensis]MCG3727222.1 methyl-accepting chemotaxis protein [Vibrio cincinnatiensis]MCG3766041.1 methyl-accepting chemotaxis protein [Vibrio cincinnatiensis]